MVWSSRSKDIPANVPAAGHPGPGGTPFTVTGYAPATTSVSFNSAAFYGAAARCSHLHTVNPAIVTPESQMIQALVEHYVDDVNAEFFLLDTCRRLKDFALSHFAGSVAAGLAYLYMVQEGYVWADQFENQTPRGNPHCRAGPDFVFARTGASDLALVEAKGTVTRSLTELDTRTRSGYQAQVEPHLGHLVGASVASHGFAIAAG